VGPVEDSMEKHPLDLEIRRIVTDSDLDGVVTAAILLRWWKKAKVEFGHPGELRAGLLDDKIDQWTAVCDLPTHPDCALCIDHHQSNKPQEATAEGPMVIWEESPSAARIAFDLVSEKVDLTDLENLLIWVDKLDSGQINREEYLSESPVLWLSWVIDSGKQTAMQVMRSLSDGLGVDKILAGSVISDVVKQKRAEREALRNAIEERIIVHNRLAVVRLDGLGMRSNGYQVTAMAGDSCDACIVVHGDLGGSFEDENRYPVSASFYTNSFLHINGGIFDLTAFATLFDPDGGGHANACGCRIKPIGGGVVEEREVLESDIERNISAWLEMWCSSLS